MDDERSYLDMLQTELADYERRRESMAARPPSVWRDANLKAWQWSIGVKRAQIAQEETRCST